MYLIDYHLHTNYSGDCKVPMENVVKSAISKGVKEIALTDHVDYDYPNSKYSFLVDFDAYINEFNKLKEKYNKEINMRLGIEMGYQPHIQDKINQLISNYPFDFVICSSHTADKLDFVNGDFFIGKTQKNAYLRYFENVLYSVENFHNYDVYGHLDFINRYGNYENKLLSYSDFTDIIDAILKNIIDTSHGIEINTSGFRYGLGQTHPHFDIVKRYKELGGEILTLGSDAHLTRDISSQFEIVIEYLKSINFKHITTFKGRKPFFIKL